MRSKASPLILFLCCCLPAMLMLARPQAVRTGISIIAVSTEDAAAQLRARIREGTSFEALAVAYSTDPTASRAGYLGLVDESSLLPEFRVALQGLKPGGVSAVTRAGDRVVLLKRTTGEEDRWRLQHDSGSAALQQGRYAEAASAYLAAVQQAQGFGSEDVRLAESLNGLVQVYRYQQNYAAAAPGALQSLSILERAIGSSHPAVLPSLVNLASIARATERYGEAEQFYRRILRTRWGTTSEDGGTADQVLEKFAEILTLVQTRDSRLDKALDDFWGSLSESQLNKDIFIGMRDKLFNAQLVPEAESLMLRAVRMNPDSRQLRYRLGELYATWGKYEKAIAVFEEATRLRVTTDLTADRVQRGRIYERIGEMNFFLVRFDDAFAALHKALEINPANTGSRLLLGALYLRRNRLDEAAAEYRRVIGAEPLSAAAHDGLAQVDLSLGRYQEAAAEAARAIEIDPALQTSRYIRAMALIRDGREEGRKALEEYQERDAELRNGQERRDEVAELERTSSALLLEQKPLKAIEVLREGIKTHQLTAILYLKLGLIQSQLGQHKEAAETFESMVRLKLDDFLTHRQLSREYEFLGNQEGAVQQRVIYLQRYDAALQSNLN